MSGRPVVRHLVLDNDAAQALLSTRPYDRRRATVVEAIAAANGQVAVPTAVRIEAAWRRRDPDAAPANRFAVSDVPLDGAGADRAVALRRLVPTASVVDSTVAVTAEGISGESGAPVEVLTSDVDHMTKLAGHVVARMVVVGLL